MKYNSKEVVYGRAFAATILAALGTRPAAALVVAPKVRLSKNPSFNPTPDNVIVDFTANEADFSGYTAGGYTPTLSAVVNLRTDTIGVVGDVLPIRSATLPGVNNAVYGYWIDDGTNVLLAEAFGAFGPFNFGSPGDFLDLEIAFPLPLNAFSE